MTISLISQPAPALTRDELAAISTSTPSTFEGIAPLLRHSEPSVAFSIDPTCQGVSSGKGTLQITEGALSFFDAATSKGLSIPYPHITLHAISRAPLRQGSSGETTGGGPCIYCQVDESDGGEHDIEESESWELILTPDNAENLDRIFETLSQCAALHPPPPGPDSSSAPAGSFFGLDPDSMVYADADGNVVGGDWADESAIPVMSAEEEVEQESAAGRAAFAHLDTIFRRPNGAANGVVANGAGEESSTEEAA